MYFILNLAGAIFCLSVGFQQHTVYILVIGALNAFTAGYCLSDDLHKGRS